jgi:hypothetical protein
VWFEGRVMIMAWEVTTAMNSCQKGTLRSCAVMRIV